MTDAVPSRLAMAMTWAVVAISAALLVLGVAWYGLSWEVHQRFWTDIFGQTFIRKRSMTRWIMHMSIFWGVLLSVMVTFPLTFGWVRFTLKGTDEYTAWFFGFPTISFPIEARTGFAIFHILDFTAILLIVGLAIALWRRINDLGLLTSQRFGFDPARSLFADDNSKMLTAARNAGFRWVYGVRHWDTKGSRREHPDHPSVDAVLDLVVPGVQNAPGV